MRRQNACSLTPSKSRCRGKGERANFVHALSVPPECREDECSEDSQVVKQAMEGWEGINVGAVGGSHRQLWTDKRPTALAGIPLDFHSLIFPICCLECYCLPSHKVRLQDFLLWLGDLLHSPISNRSWSVGSTIRDCNWAFSSVQPYVLATMTVLDLSQELLKIHPTHM